VANAFSGKPRSSLPLFRHAGYSYSGPCAAWAYAALDLRGATRVFVLGPSHTYYLRGCALSTHAVYATPLGDLVVDREVMAELRKTGRFKDIPRDADEDEHSLEMHLPYLYKRVQQTFADVTPDKYPTVVPILIGDNDGPQEKEFGAILAPYLRDPRNAFIVSSDFCHWGQRFGYVAYLPEGKLEQKTNLQRGGGGGSSSSSNSSRRGAGGSVAAPSNPPIHESIRILDKLAMDAIESGSHDAFVGNLEHTRNTVCGRHPIGVAMAALEVLGKESKEAESGGAGNDEEKRRFKFVQYQRSSLVHDVSDSSVSYASAYALV